MNLSRIDLYIMRALDADGDTSAGALITVYRAGTTTETDIFADAAGATPLAQPVVCDAAGNPPPIYVTGYSALKIKVTTALGADLPGSPFDNYRVASSRKPEFDTLADAIASGDALEAGQQVRILGHLSPGDIGAMDAEYTGSDNLSYPLSGPFKPMNKIPDAAMWGGGLSNPDVDPESLEAMAAFMNAEGKTRGETTGDYTVDRATLMDIPQFCTVDISKATFTLTHADATLNFNPDADFTVSTSVTTIRHVEVLGGRFFGQGDGENATGVTLNLLRGITFRKTYFTGLKVGANIAGKDTVLFHDCYWFNCAIPFEISPEYVPSLALTGNTTLSIVLDKCHLSVSGSEHGISLTGPFIDYKIQGGSINGTPTGSQIKITDNAIGARTESILIEGVHFENYGTSGAISIATPNGNEISNIKILNNEFIGDDEDIRDVIKLSGNLNGVDIHGNLGRLGNPPSGTNEMILVRADGDGITDMRIGTDNRFAGQTARCSRIDAAIFEANRGIELFPRELEANNQRFGAPYTGITILGTSGTIDMFGTAAAGEVNGAVSRAPAHYGVAPRFVLLEVSVTANANKTGTWDEERIIFSPSIALNGTQGAKSEIQLNGMLAGETRTRLIRVGVLQNTTVPAETTRTVYWDLRELTGGTTKMSVTALQYIY